MSQVIPPWLTGSGISGIQLVPITSDPGDAIAYGTAYAMAGLCKQIRIGGKRNFDEVMALDESIATKVLHDDTMTIQLDELMLSSVGPQGASAFMTHSHVQFTVTRGGETWSVICILESWDELLQRTQNTGTLGLLMQQTDGGSPITYGS